MLVALALLALFAWQVVDVLLLVFAAVLVATALRALADLVERYTPLPAGWALACAIASVIATLALAAWLFGSEVQRQVVELRDALPRAWETLKAKFGNMAWFDTLQARVDGGFGGMSGVLASVRWAATSLLAIVANVLLVGFGAIYIATQPDLYRTGLLALVPPKLRGRAESALEACGGALRLWVVGQLVAMVIVGVLTGVGLWLVGLPSAFALGLIAGVAEFVPILGPLLAAVPGLMLAVAEGPQMVLWVVAVYLAVQQIENHVVMPVVQRRAVSLPPALTLFSVVAMAIVFGPLGLLLATPLTVVAFVLVKKLYIVDTLHEKTDVPGT
jgi:predicted PurR-regulated permease PerM